MSAANIVVGAFLRQFGPTSSTSAPAQPTLTINDAGTLATVSGSTTGSTNDLQYLAAPTGEGSFTWTALGSRTSDGGISFSLDPGRYWFRIVSTTSGGSAVSNLVFKWIGVLDDMLDHSPADIVRRLLIAQSFAANPSPGGGDTWPAYCSYEPDLPDNCITTYDVDGTDDGRFMVDGAVQGFYGVQIRLRGKDHPTVWSKSSTIYEALGKTVYDEPITIDGTAYLVHAFGRIGDVLMLGKEPNSKRCVMAINAMVSIKQLT